MGVQDNLSQNIKIGLYGVYITWSNKEVNVYEIVKWNSEPYTKQDHTIGTDEKSKNCRMVDVVYYDLINKKERQYEISKRIETVPMIYVLMIEIKVFKSNLRRRFKKRTSL